MKFQAPTYPAGDANRYCGPSVISAVTGLTTGEAARLLRHVTGLKSIKGTHPHEIRKALDECGVRMIRQAGVPEMTLAAWFKRPRESGAVYLVEAGNHWQAVRGLRFVDGIARAVVPFDHPAVKRRARVTAVWKLEARGKILKPAAAIKPKVKPAVDREAKAAKEFRRLAKLHNADWEGHPTRDTGGPFMVWGLHDFDMDEDVDPYAGDHSPSDWDDALERLKAYVALKKAAQA